MKLLLSLFAVSIVSFSVRAQTVGTSEEQLRSLQKQLDALHEAFASGDAARVAALHHPNIVKYFVGNQVVNGRAELEKGLAAWFRTTKVEFIENTVESTVFNGETAIQVCIFGISATPKSGGEPTIIRGRSMVVYMRDKSSPTGWLSLREMTQEAPEKK